MIGKKTDTQAAPTDLAYTAAAAVAVYYGNNQNNRCFSGLRPSLILSISLPAVRMSCPAFLHYTPDRLSAYY